ncbi:MAG: long-chain fatty acid--CoA ligase, partial [Rhodospirillales bacterium]
MATMDELLAGLPRRISHLLWQWEERRPDAPALVEADRRLSFAQLGEAVRALKVVLVEAGIRPGDRVMLVNENCLELCALILAIADLDAWSVIVNARLSAREIDAIRDHSGARRLIYTAAVSKDATAHGQRHGAETLDLPGLGSVLMGPLNASAWAEPVDFAGAEQVAALIYTSGTTGQPKGVMLTHRNVLFIGCVSGQQRGLIADDLVYGVLPISHIFGLSSVFVGTLYAGGCLMICSRFDPGQVLADVAAGMTVLQGVPAMYAKILEYVKSNHSTIQVNRLRYMSAGGSPLDPAIKIETEAVFGLTLNNGYGQTEASPTISQTRIGQPRADCSVGPALPGVKVRMIGLNGKAVPQGEVGELWCNGPGVMKG